MILASYPTAMASMKKHAAPIIVAILLLLLVLYVGSYLALVRPDTIVIDPGGSIHVTMVDANDLPVPLFARRDDYRFTNSLCKVLFWPLEQIDRKVRPGAWDDNLRDFNSSGIPPLIPPSAARST